MSAWLIDLLSVSAVILLACGMTLAPVLQRNRRSRKTALRTARLQFEGGEQNA
ncbi:MULTISPECIES: hypothetical protein [unclassified Hahella]|uniref:hypothetical protein n=1 Tax=unclassified Hahella TaxID=2624107 RepID=UPI0013E2B557|nr:MULTISPECIES: hypothetical protein [unclassified Hahella]MBU6954066.1 hypothetical protein [Hahella sp. HN01]MDG9668853.1 hypothetical protein [Hahella sp. CR1]